MKVLYLFNKVLAKTIDDARQGKGHDSWCFGMLRLPKYGVQADHLEIEQFMPFWLTRFLRRHILTMHYAHLPLFPLFFRYDIVFTSTAYSSLVLKALLHIKRFKWVILDFNVLGTIADGKGFRQKMYAWAVSKADGIVCISQAAADAMKKRFPKLAENVIFLREATDPNYFKPQLDLPAGGMEKDVVISVGNYGRDFTTVIEATKGLNVECRLATKPASAVKYRHMSIDMPETIPPHVTVKTYPHDKMLHAFAESKVAVVAVAKRDDYTDSVGTFALGEAMSMGKAVIVTHTKSMESYVKDGINGVFVPYKDQAAMRTEISKLLRNADLRSRLGSEARKFAVEYLDPERFARGLAEYFKKL